MLTKLFKLTLFVLLVTSLFSPSLAFAQDDLPPWECPITLAEPEPGCPGSVTDPISALEIEDQTVEILYHLNLGRLDQLYKVKLAESGEVRWIQLGIWIRVRIPTVENGITLFDYSDEIGEYQKSGPVPSIRGTWVNDPDYPANFANLYLTHQPTTKDKYVESMWNSFVKRVQLDSNLSYTYDDPAGKARYMLWRWYKFGSPKTYDAFFYYVYGEHPQRDASYIGKYGADWISGFYQSIEIGDQTEYLDMMVVTFAKLPPEAIYSGYLCQTPKYFMRGLEFDHTKGNTAYFTYNGEIELVNLGPSAKYLAVFTESQMPSWGEYYSEVEEFPSTFKVWQLCR